MKRLTLAAIRNGEDWRERLKLAENNEPGTPFDLLFAEAESALKLLDMKMQAEGENRLAAIGLEFALLFRTKHGIQVLHDMGAALNTWHSHKPKRKHADAIRETLIALNGMFPPRKPRIKLLDNKIVKRGRWPKLTVRVVIQNLEAQEIKCRSDEHSKNRFDRIRREIQRQAKALNIPLDSTPGRPGQKHTQKP
jgi:hypothetical protein